MTGEVRARSSTYFTEVKRRRRRLRLDISKAKIAAVLRGEEGGGVRSNQAIHIFCSVVWGSVGGLSKSLIKILPEEVSFLHCWAF